MTTKHDPQSVVRALELTLERHSNVEWKAGDAAILHAALAVARSMVEQWEELVEAKAAGFTKRKIEQAIAVIEVPFSGPVPNDDDSVCRMADMLSPGEIKEIYDFMKEVLANLTGENCRTCSRCGEEVGELDPDGCRDPDCPMV